MSYDPSHPLDPTYGTPPPATQPLPLGEAIKQLPARYWRAVSQPRATTYAEEKGRAAWNIVWVQLIFLAVFSAIISFLVFNFYVPTIMNAYMSPAMFNSSVPSQAAQQALQINQRIIASMQAASVPVSLGDIIFVPLSLLIGLGILQLIAKAFGGQGTFVQYIYGYLLFGVPLTIVSALLGFIPYLGSLVAAVIGIYHIVLQILMTMGVHRLSGGKATLVVLLPVIVIFVLAIIVFFIIFSAIMGSMMQR
ncbi:MAG TPA: YIP1 family protein [Ktedonobacteraceae bacterium]|nr:YIP1 family protein [Ktedonobacteraceae bacterium]